MSEEILKVDTIIVTKYAGPELPFNAERTRYQITNIDTRQIMTFSAAEWNAFVNKLRLNESLAETAMELHRYFCGSPYHDGC